MSARADVPDWVADGSFYGNNPYGLQAAIARWSIPVTTPAERAAAHGFVVSKTRASAFPCGGCGRFAFPAAGVLCWWCRREDEKWGSS